MLYDHIIYRLNICLSKNDANLLIAVVPFEVMCMELHTASLVVMLPFTAFCKVHCLKYGKCFLWLCSDHGNIIKSPVI
jgi:hypothetical protein